MKILCLTGWQQEHDALKTLAPDAIHFAYDNYDNVDTMFAALPACDIAIGWSLGGQLLVRAIAKKIITPKKLVLLGASFQCVSDAYFSHGMSVQDLAFVKNNYVNDAQAMLAQFQTLVATGDKNQIDIVRKLSNVPVWKNGLFWLEELGRTTCRDLDFTHFPETFIVHGEADRVISLGNAAAFAKAILHANVFLLEERGHALHFQALPFSL